MTWSSPNISAKITSDEERADCRAESADPGVEKFNSRPVAPSSGVGDGWAENKEEGHARWIKI